MNGGDVARDGELEGDAGHRVGGRGGGDLGGVEGSSVDDLEEKR